MRVLMTGLIMLALLAAGGAAVLVKRYLDSQAANQAKLAETAKQTASVFVLVADETLPAGTNVTSGALRWQKWPDDAVESEFLSSANRDPKIEKKIVGTIVRRAVVAGTPITEEMVFRRGSAGFLAGALDDGKRAVAVSVDATSGAAGFILPGDRVDVVLTFDVRELTRGLGSAKASTEGGDDEEKKPTEVGPAKYSSETVLDGVRVLAIDQSFNDVDGEAAVAKTVTLEVSPKQVEVLAVARAMGKISLSLRSLSVEQPARTTPGTFTSDVDISPTLRKVILRMIDEEKRKREEKEESKLEEERRKREADRRRTRGKSAPSSSGGTTVRVYRGGEETTQEFPKR